MATAVERHVDISPRLPPGAGDEDEEIFSIKETLRVIPDLTIDSESLVDCLAMNIDKDDTLRFTSHIPEIQYTLDRDVNRLEFIGREKIHLLMELLNKSNNRYKMIRMGYTDMETNESGHVLQIYDTVADVESYEYDESRYSSIHIQAYIITLYYITTVYNVQYNK